MPVNGRCGENAAETNITEKPAARAEEPGEKQ
jgi:hypothetical protein